MRLRLPVLRFTLELNKHFIGKHLFSLVDVFAHTEVEA